MYLRKYISMINIEVYCSKRLDSVPGSYPHVCLPDFLSIHDLCTREPIMESARYINMYSAGILPLCTKDVTSCYFLLRHKTDTMITYAYTTLCLLTHVICGRTGWETELNVFPVSHKCFGTPGT